MLKSHFDTKMKETLSRVPEEFHANIRHFAKNRGGRYGHTGVLQYTIALVELIEQPLMEYAERLFNDMKGP